jgi:hypothetical protein
MPLYEHTFPGAPGRHPSSSRSPDERIQGVIEEGKEQGRQARVLGTEEHAPSK